MTKKRFALREFQWFCVHAFLARVNDKLPDGEKLETPEQFTPDQRAELDRWQRDPKVARELRKSFDEQFVVLDCAWCGPGCRGFHLVDNTPEKIQEHAQLQQRVAEEQAEAERHAKLVAEDLAREAAAEAAAEG